MTRTRGCHIVGSELSETFPNVSRTDQLLNRFENVRKVPSGNYLWPPSVARPSDGVDCKYRKKQNKIFASQHVSTLPSGYNSATPTLTPYQPAHTASSSNLVIAWCQRVVRFNGRPSPVGLSSFSAKRGQRCPGKKPCHHLPCSRKMHKALK